MSEEQLPVRYEVGYGKPPTEHRFQKGMSGNPRGRPRRKKQKATQIDTGLGMRAAEEFLRLEAYRPVTIREGERLIELPAIQAVFRAMGVAALKGNRFVQKTLAEMVTRVEADDHRSRMELFANALDYKDGWDRAIADARAAGRPEPRPVPHPDDILLNPNTGEVRILGPQTKEQQAQFDRAIARRAEAQEEVSSNAARYRRARKADDRAHWLREWHYEQRMFDIINDALPKRYKAKLKDRSWAEGASRPGQTLTGRNSASSGR